MVSMESSVADDFYSGEGFWNFLPCKILSIASENLSYLQEKPVTLTDVIISNYGMPMPCMICMPVVEQKYESSHSRVVE